MTDLNGLNDLIKGKTGADMYHSVQRKLLKEALEKHTRIIEVIEAVCEHNKFNIRYSTNEFDLFFDDWSEISLIRRLGYKVTYASGRRLEPPTKSSIPPEYSGRPSPEFIERAKEALKRNPIAVDISWDFTSPNDVPALILTEPLPLFLMCAPTKLWDGLKS